jgi:hypothetical protein
MDRYGLVPGLVLFRLLVPLQPRVVDHTWYGVSDSLAVSCWREPGRIQIFLIVTDGTRYPVYKTSTSFSNMVIRAINFFFASAHL